MTHTELYPTPLEEVYGAKEFAQTWSAYNEPAAPPEPQMVVNIVVEDTPPQADVNHNIIDSKRPPDGDIVDVLGTDVERSATDAGGDDGKGGTEVFSLAGCDVVVVNGDRGDVPSDDDGRDTASDLREAPSADGETFAIVEGLAKIRLDMGYSDTQLDDSSRQYAWERGHIDYRGIDSFDNIRRQLDKVLSDPKLNAGASKGN
ncbi:hypothetical protein NP493_3914g00012 [Ridgeia piscesae]|uniref:Uncharacterized protein n=1 Tax=Ridgeia piscesae TaxID=27915 RepID=A0AAD9J3U5_RIDPI|nr:hypothetical protein NP493_3914g00012 [Ridgeia piscesae]